MFESEDPTWPGTSLGTSLETEPSHLVGRRHSRRANGKAPDPHRSADCRAPLCNVHRSMGPDGTSGGLAAALAVVLAIPDGIWDTPAQITLACAVLMVGLACTVGCLRFSNGNEEQGRPGLTASE